MATADVFFRTAFSQLLGCVLADRLQQAVVGLPPMHARSLHADERLVDEAGEQVEDVAGGDDSPVGGDSLHRLQVEAAGEDGQPLQEDLFGWWEQVVTPGHRRPEALLACGGGAGTDAQQPETNIEAISY